VFCVWATGTKQNETNGREDFLLFHIKVDFKMHQIRTEEKAALLLPEADDDEEQMDLSPIKPIRPTILNDDDIPVVKKRPRTYHRSSTTSSQPFLCVALILFAFIFGCVSGVVVMLYRMAQDAEQNPSTTTTTNSPTKSIDDYRTIQMNFFQFLNQTNRKNFSHSTKFDVEQWKSMSNGLIEVKSRIYPIDLVKFSSTSSSNGIELIDTKTEKVLSKFDGLNNDEFLFLSSFIRSTTLNSTSIYYLNYGRHEDFAFLIKNRIFLQDAEQSIGFIRRKTSLISVNDQIRHAIYFRFGAIVLFDDEENSSTTTTNDREDSFREWARSRNRPIEKLLFGISKTENRSTSILSLSLGDVQRIFASLQPDSNFWLSTPSEWRQNSTIMKIGGSLSTIRLRLTSQIEQIQKNFSANFAVIRGTIDPEHFLLVSSSIDSTQQNEILRTFIEQIRNGWKPKRSIVFAFWSGSQFDHFTLRRWFEENFDLIKGKLIGFIDLGRGVTGNSTFNLHGSTLFEQIVRRAAETVKNPFETSSTCRQSSVVATTTMMMKVEGEHQHEHGKRKRREETICQSTNLFDQWKKISNQSRNFVQMIDVNSDASICQIEFGIPSLLIEMTDSKEVNFDSFYGQKIFVNENNDVQSEFFVVYSQFVTDVVRQMIDEIPIGFNLTIYADEIDRYVKEYFDHFAGPYQALAYHLGDSNELKKFLSDLTKSMRQIQLKIDQIDKNDFVRWSLFNAELIEFESLFLFSNQTFFIDEHFKHFLLGPAFGLTNTVVPFPSLSNLLYNIPFDPSEEFCNAAVIYSSQIRDQIRQIIRRLNGLNELF